MAQRRSLYSEIDGAIVCYVLEHDEATRGELQQDLRYEAAQIEEAVTRLVDGGLVSFHGGCVSPTGCCRYMDILGLVKVGPVSPGAGYTRGRSYSCDSAGAKSSFGRRRTA